MKNQILSLALAILPTLGISQTFTEIIKTVAFDREADDRFGYAVDISGNYAIVVRMGTISVL